MDKKEALKFICEIVISKYTVPFFFEGFVAIKYMLDYNITKQDIADYLKENWKLIRKWRDYSSDQRGGNAGFYLESGVYKFGYSDENGHHHEESKESSGLCTEFIFKVCLMDDNIKTQNERYVYFKNSEGKELFIHNFGKQMYEQIFENERMRQILFGDNHP